MRLYFLIITVLASLYFYDPLHAQDIDIIDAQLKQAIELISEKSSAEEQDLSYILDGLKILIKYPVNINTEEIHQLVELRLLNTTQALSIRSHIIKNGKLIDIYELQAIDGLNLKSIQLLLPFITIAEKSTPKDLIRSLKNNEQILILRHQRCFEKAIGYNTHELSGAREKLYLRYVFNGGNKVKFGITSENDEGEEFFSGINKQGFDFYSAHLTIQNYGVIRTMIVGDYQLSLGQGLCAWSGYSFGKSSDIVQIEKIGDAVRPYTSSDENNFFRGGATTLQIRNFYLIPFFSSNKIDGTISTKDPNTGKTTTISALAQTGIHSYGSEKEGKDAVLQQVYGGNVGFQNDFLKIGLTAMSSQLDAELTRTATLYNKFNFSGSIIQNYSSNASFHYRNMNLFGEIASNDFQNHALLAGMNAALHEKISIAALYRNYSPGYFSFFSNAFGENYTNNNESGFYFGSSILLKPTFSINIYHDIFLFPWLKHGVNNPSNGNESFIQFNFDPDKKTSFYIRFRVKNKEENIFSSSFNKDITMPYKQSNLRLHLTFQATPLISSKSRIEWVNVNNHSGFMAFQELSIANKKKNISATLRYALFDTDNYDARIYSYENDVLYYFYTPSFYNKGSRTYLLLNFNISKNLELWIKLSQTYYDNKDVIGSGPYEIFSKHKTDVRTQLRVLF